MKIKLNKDVTEFLDKLKHPLRKEIEETRCIILAAGAGLEENIKWNGPNYSVGEYDCVTMRIQPPKQVQLVFHRGAKVLKQPKDRLIEDASGLMDWKANDRAVITFRSMDEIKAAKKALTAVVKKWVEVLR